MGSQTVPESRIRRAGGYVDRSYDYDVGYSRPYRPYSSGISSSYIDRSSDYVRPYSGSYRDYGSDYGSYSRPYSRYSSSYAERPSWNPTSRADISYGRTRPYSGSISGSIGGSIGRSYDMDYLPGPRISSYDDSYTSRRYPTSRTYDSIGPRVRSYDDSYISRPRYADTWIDRPRVTSYDDSYLDRPRRYSGYSSPTYPRSYGYGDRLSYSGSYVDTLAKDERCDNWGVDVKVSHQPGYGFWTDGEWVGTSGSLAYAPMMSTPIQYNMSSVPMTTTAPMTSTLPISAPMTYTAPMTTTLPTTSMPATIMPSMPMTSTLGYDNYVGGSMNIPITTGSIKMF